jgi:hypothetical protein
VGRPGLPPSARRPLWVFLDELQTSTNRSHLLSTTVNAKAARMIGAEWDSAPAPEILTRLDKYTYLASVTVGTRAIPRASGTPADRRWRQRRRIVSSRTAQDRVFARVHGYVAVEIRA